MNLSPCLNVRYSIFPKISLNKNNAKIQVHLVRILLKSRVDKYINYSVSIGVLKTEIIKTVYLKKMIFWNALFVECVNIFLWRRLRPQPI